MSSLGRWIKLVESGIGYEIKVRWMYINQVSVSAKMSCLIRWIYLGPSLVYYEWSRYWECRHLLFDCDTIRHWFYILYCVWK